MRPLLVALTLLMVGEAAVAAADDPPRTSSVAEMLQRRQEHQLRDQLAREGRWEEIRNMDAAQLRQRQVQTKQALNKLNAELAREGTVELPVNGDGVYSYCAPAGAAVKSDAPASRPRQVSAGSSAGNPR